MKITSAPSPIRTAARQQQPKGFLDRVGDRFQFAGGQALYGAGLAVATSAIPFAVTAGISRLVAPYVPYGGMVANLLVGGGLGAVIAGTMHDKFVGAPRNRAEQEGKRNEMLAGAAFGAFTGFLGTAATPVATYVDWAGVGIMGGTFTGVAAAALAVPNFFGGLFKGPQSA